MNAPGGEGGVGLADDFREDDARKEPSLVVVKGRPFNAETPLEALRADVTPSALHYVRCNFDIPRLSPETHRLSVGGEVDRPLSLSMEALASLPRRTLTVTLECAGNNRLDFTPLPPGEPWERGAVGTSTWAGVPLREVLARAGVRPGAVEILAEGADGGTVRGADVPLSFARALPREVAFHEDTLLALEMNGEPLTPEHGAPVRLLVPGWYAMASVKWLSRLSALTQPFHGHFQTERYVYDGDGRTEPVQRMRVKALLVSPAEGAAVRAGAPFTVQGQAWSGEGPVVRVEVAVDGEDWREAELLGEPSPYAWRAFRCELAPLEPGRHTLRCRATDEKGNVQPDAPPWNRLGYGNNAVRPVVIHAR